MKTTKKVEYYLSRRKKNADLIIKAELKPIHRLPLFIIFIVLAFYSLFLPDDGNDIFNNDLLIRHINNVLEDDKNRYSNLYIDKADK